MQKEIKGRDKEIIAGFASVLILRALRKANHLKKRKLLQPKTTG